MADVSGLSDEIHSIVGAYLQSKLLVPSGIERLRLDRGGADELGRQGVRDAVAADAILPLKGGPQLLEALAPAGAAADAALGVELIIRTVASLQGVRRLDAQHAVRVAET